MPDSFEIRPLQEINLADILPIVTGYVSHEKFAVEKTETGEQVVFNIHLVPLETPHSTSFAQDFNEEDCQRYAQYLIQDFSFGAYVADKLVAFAISEVVDWQQALRIWEFQVMEGYRRRGIGRALMNYVVDKATQTGLRIVFLETQNTNVDAIRFYRRMGYALDALDLSFYTNDDVENGEVAFFMKRKIK